ncbi:hypothetical protein B7L65_04710 [Xanthomonas citri pv. citri]|nr:hypothetical protein B7L65_04710 [Xanthomonas citri pv. citri]ARR24398.1 hypothetical protein B7L67_07640 [Xanthomonas citri pv. citri]
MPGASDTQRGNEGLQAGFEPSAAERRKGVSALEDHHVRGTVSETGLQIVTELMNRRRTARAMAGLGNGNRQAGPLSPPHARTLHRPA